MGKISGDTLVPISLIVSFAVSLGGSIYYIARVSARAETNTRQIEHVRVKRSQADQRIYDRLNLTDAKVSEIAGDVKAISAKLDLLIELKQIETQHP